MPLHLPHTSSANLPRSNLLKSRKLISPLSQRTTIDNGSFCYSPFPFDKLPLELQIEIFTHCLPQFPHLTDNDEAPLLISRVCKAWKSLVLSTPRLWSAFEVEITGSGSRPTLSPRDADTVNTMKLWLKQSKNYPLAVRIVHVPVGRTPDPRSAQLLNALIPEARRWRHVEFIVPAVHMSALQYSLPADFPSLQSLTLQLKGAANADLPFDISRLNIPWHQLVALDLQLEYDNFITLDKCLEILSETRRLKRCSIDAFCTLERPGTYSNGIMIPTLEELHLNIHGNRAVESTIQPPSASLTRFINLLTLPRLHTFQLAWQVKERALWSQTHPEFVQFLSRLSKTIRTLGIHYLPLSDYQLLECLVHVPNLTHLDLRFSLSDIDRDPITETLFMECTLPALASSSVSSRSGKAQSKSKAVVPLLEHLNVQCHGRGYTPTGLISFVESRWSSRSPGARPVSYGGALKSFHILSMNLPLVSLDKRVKQWRDEGLDISVDGLVVR